MLTTSRRIATLLSKSFLKYLRLYPIFLYVFCLGEPADGWQQLSGIDDAAYYFPKFKATYPYAVDYCKRYGGKVFEPTEKTNWPVHDWVEVRPFK